MSKSVVDIVDLTENEFGNKLAEKSSPVFQKLKDRIQAIPEQANYQYVMMRFLLGKKSATRDEIAEELKRWNEDKPDNFDFKRAPVFDTNIVKNFITRTNLYCKIYRFKKFKYKKIWFNGAI